mmetsp:Transcript_29666/g.78652  ORF Transcript_29666/g.78652 Transcript_29666/m.78652 type:complete len:797 (-) Transcript_29666:43-2433(-)
MAGSSMRSICSWSVGFLALILALLSRYSGDLRDAWHGISYAWFIDDCRAPQQNKELGSDAGLEKITVAFASEPKRFEGLLSSMLSLAQHLQEPGLCEIHVIVPVEALPDAEQLKACFDQEMPGPGPTVFLHALKPLPFDVTRLEGLWTSSSSKPFLSPLLFARVYVHEYLPSARRVVWLDDHVVIKADLGPLYRMHMKHTLAAAHDAKSATWESVAQGRHLASHISDFQSRPLHESVLVIDLLRWKNERVDDKLCTWLGLAHGSMQLALNLEFQGKFDVLDWPWNVKVGGVLPPERCLNGAKILHWVGTTPWRSAEPRLRSVYHDALAVQHPQFCGVLSRPEAIIVMGGPTPTRRGPGSRKILAYASLVCASSHQLTIRRAAEALAAAGHEVTLVEPLAARGRHPSVDGLTVWFVDVMSDAEYDQRFKAGESFQILSQEINAQFLPKVLPGLAMEAFDLAVVDALYPVLAKELALPSLHVQCSSDEEALNSLWFHYGLSASGHTFDHVRFAGLWFLSWLLVGTHQDHNDHARLSWDDYFQHYVVALLVQGVPAFTLPQGLLAIATAHPSRVQFVGSATARPSTPPAEIEGTRNASLALVAFGTHVRACPVEILQALAEVGLVAVVLIDACRGENLPPQHFVPRSRDQIGWLQAPGMRLAVVHGGIHSLLEAVSVGLPVACVPQEGDQWANCRDLQQQGFGWAIHPNASSSEASRSLNFILEREFPRHSMHQFQEYGGPAAIVRVVERFGREEARDPLTPFFSNPFGCAEGWVAVFGALHVLAFLVYVLWMAWSVIG